MEKQENIFEIFSNCFLITAAENTATSETKEVNFTDLPTSAGLVLFSDRNDRPIALLTAANIRRTVKNKLSGRQEKTKRADFKSITAKVYYSVYQCPFRLAIRHYDAARKIFRDNYRDYITLISPWYLTVNLNHRIPFFHITGSPSFQEGWKTLGPFPSRHSAAVVMAALEDCFKLCRKSELTNTPDYAKSCPYLQMDACIGVCAGKVSINDYKKIIEDAFNTGAKPDEAIGNFENQMRTAAKELNFEKAAAIRKKIEKLSVLKKPIYHWTGDLTKLKIVHIDKSAKVKTEGSKARKQSYAVFAINVFQIIDAGDFVWDSPDMINDAVRKALEKLSQTVSDDMLERFSIAAWFLYRSKPSGTWLKAPSEQTCDIKWNELTGKNN